MAMVEKDAIIGVLTYMYSLFRQNMIEHVLGQFQVVHQKSRLYLQKFLLCFTIKIYEGKES